MEVLTLYNMPDQTLLDNDDNFDDGELDLSSFGEAVQPQEDDNPDQAEQQEKEKTMSIREKLKNKRDNASGTASAKSRKGGIITSVLVLLLLIVGVLVLLQLRELSDRLSTAMMSASSFDGTAPAESNPPREYAIDFILDPNIPDRMAARGREGWQVVGSRRTQDSTSGQYGYEFIFMRRIQGR